MADLDEAAVSMVSDEEAVEEEDPTVGPVLPMAYPQPKPLQDVPPPVPTAVVKEIVEVHTHRARKVNGSPHCKPVGVACIARPDKWHLC